MAFFNIYKVIIAGEGGVGKTTLTNRYLTGEFIGDTMITLGVAFFVKKINIDEEITLQLWDLGGQEQFKSMGVFEKYVEGAHGAILAFDLTRLETLLSLPDWAELITNCAGDIPMVLIGTKADLVVEIQVTEDLIIETKKTLNILKYFETSSLTGLNIENVFIELAREIQRINCEKHS